MIEHQLLSDYTMQVICHGDVLINWIDIDHSGIRPGDIYKKGVVDFQPRMSATFGEVDIDAPYLINDQAPLIKAVPMGTIMYIRYKGKIEKMTFYSSEEFRKLVTTITPITLGFCINCGIPYFKEILICENCGVKIGEMGMG